MNEQSKKAIEKAVNKAAAAIRSLTGVFEQHGEAVEQVNGSFKHLADVVVAMQHRSTAVVLANNAATGTFSLDAMPTEKLDMAALFPMPVPTQTFVVEGIKPAPVAPTPTPAPTPVKPKWIKPEGRLAGSKEPIYPVTETTKPIDDIAAKPDKTGFIKDAGFLEN